MIIFFHGFASVGTSAKSQALHDAFVDQTVVSPDLPTNPADVIKLVESYVQAAGSDRVVFVGTSLGGFYANYCAQYFDAPCVIANPSTRPSVTIGKRVGENTNMATKETFLVTEDHIKQLADMEEYLKSNSNGALVNLFLAHDDAVLDYRVALEDIPHRKRLFQFPDGGHRFEEHWDEVIKVVANVIADA